MTIQAHKFPKQIMKSVKMQVHSSFIYIEPNKYMHSLARFC